jgi:hypothetical protein
VAIKSAVPQIAQRGGRGRGEQFAPFAALEHRRLAGLDDVLGSAHRSRRVHWYDLPGNEPVEQHAHRRKLLLHTRRRVLLLQVFDPTWTAGRDFAIENGRNAGG